MTKQLKKQLKHQRQQLHLELPPNTARILTKLLKRGFDSIDDDLNSLDNETIEMGAVPSPACETARVAVKSELLDSKKKQLKLIKLNLFYFLIC